MAFCSACGAQLVEGEAFCHACGTAVPGVMSAAAESSERRTGRIALIVIAAVLGSALVVGALAYWGLSRTASGGASGGTGSSLATPTAGGSTSATTPPTTSTNPQPPATKPATKPSATANDVTHQATFILKSGVADGGANTLTFDYVQFLTGSAAQKAAQAKGDTVENDYYVLNDNPKLRTFPVSSAAVIVLHPGNGPQVKRTFTIGEFKTLIGSHTATYGGNVYDWSNETTYYINIKNGKVTRIENQWVP